MLLPVLLFNIAEGMGIGAIADAMVLLRSSVKLVLMMSQRIAARNADMQSRLWNVVNNS